MTQSISRLGCRFSTTGRAMKRAAAACIALAAALALPIAAVAHNAGHFSLPDGSCLEIGSFRDAPLVGADRTPLDLVPETPNPPRDEYGVSFVGFWGNTPISPGACPAQLSSAIDIPAGTNETDLWASQGYNGI